MSQEQLEQQTRRLARDFLGRELQALTTMEEVVKAVSNSEVFLVFAEHQWVAIGSETGRLRFFNPSATDSPNGTIVSGDELPERRVEDEGEESASLETLSAWMAQGRMRALRLV